MSYLEPSEFGKKMVDQGEQKIFMSTKEFTEVSNRISADSVKRDFHLKATTKTMKEGIPRPRSSNVLSQDALGSSTVCI